MKIGKINRQSIGISGFTSVLSEYKGMPTTLFIAGTLPAKKVPSVAIIGSRRPTAYGKEVTYTLASQLAKRGVIIVSGLAYGIDAIAHQAALDAGGTTIAVLANGLHRIYPSAHTQLAEHIVKAGGGIITEYPEGTEAHKYHFLARNRIVSGLVDAIIITEATERSGTLSTVGHAIDQNKEVCAVPGPITSLLSAGPNQLLRQGVHPVTCADDILEIIAPHLLTSPSLTPLGDTPLEQSIIEQLQAGVRDRDALIRSMISEPTETVLQALTMLELRGIIATHAGDVFLR